MFLLPKGNPLAENVPIAKLQLPEALDKLKNGKLTGCATFDFPAADCALIYDDGKLISALVRREDGTEIKDADALNSLIQLMVLAGSGNFNVYGFSKDVNHAVLALVRGTSAITRQELKQIDFKALLERIKTERMTATLKIYTDQRAGMILYRDGATVGFFYDKAASIETTAGEVQQIAALPGACVDLLVLKGAEELTLDLAGLVDIKTLWDNAKGNIFAKPEAPKTAQAAPAQAAAPQAAKQSTQEIETAIIELANSFVGKLGKTLAEKEMMNVGGIKALKNESSLNEFLAAIEKGSKLLASANKIKELREAIIVEVAKI